MKHISIDMEEICFKLLKVFREIKYYRIHECAFVEKAILSPDDILFVEDEEFRLLAREIRYYVLNCLGEIKASLTDIVQLSWDGHFLFLTLTDKEL